MEGAVVPNIHILWRELISFCKAFFVLNSIANVGYFVHYENGKTSVELHRRNILHFGEILRGIRSSSTCLCCLRRRPQYFLPCGHCLCENCVMVFGDVGEDPCLFKLPRCLFCNEAMEPVAVRVRPPTAGAGFLCIDGGGTRGIIPLSIMKLLQDRLGSIPLQRCIPLSFGVSVGESLSNFPLSRLILVTGAIIAIDHFILGRPLEESIVLSPTW